MAWFKEKRIKDKPYLSYVATLPCFISGIQANCVAHHLLITPAGRGVGLKSPDDYVLPLHYTVHARLHAKGDENAFFAKYSIENQADVAQELYRRYKDKDFDGCLELINTRGKTL